MSGHTKWADYKRKRLALRVISRSDGGVPWEARPYDLQAADVLLVHGHHPLDLLTQAATRSRWNHAALVVTPSGDLIEMVNGGVRWGHLAHYAPADRIVLRAEMTAEQRISACNYAMDIASRHERYSYLGLLCVALRVVSGSRIELKADGAMICSEFVADCLGHGGVDLGIDAPLVTPADLYRRFVAG